MRCIWTKTMTCRVGVRYMMMRGDSVCYGWCIWFRYVNSPTKDEERKPKRERFHNIFFSYVCQRDHYRFNLFLWKWLWCCHKMIFDMGSLIFFFFPFSSGSFCKYAIFFWNFVLLLGERTQESRNFLWAFLYFMLFSESLKHIFAMNFCFFSLYIVWGVYIRP